MVNAVGGFGLTPGDTATTGAVEDCAGLGPGETTTSFSGISGLPIEVAGFVEVDKGDSFTNRLFPQFLILLKKLFFCVEFTLEDASFSPKLNNIAAPRCLRLVLRIAILYDIITF